MDKLFVFLYNYILPNIYHVYFLQYPEQEQNYVPVRGSSNNFTLIVKLLILIFT